LSRTLDLAKEHDFREEAIDAQMLMGDYQWGTPGSRIEALKAYTKALVTSFELGIEVMVRVGMHTFQQLFSIGADDRLPQIDRLERLLQAWLQRDLGPGNDLDTAAVLLWPLHVARRVTLATADGRSLSAQATTTILREEIFESVGKRK